MTFWQEIITLTRPIHRGVWNLPHKFHLYLIINQIVGICEVCDKKVLYLQCKTKNGLVNKYGMAIHDRCCFKPCFISISLNCCSTTIMVWNKILFLSKKKFLRYLHFFFRIFASHDILNNFFFSLSLSLSLSF